MNRIVIDPDVCNGQPTIRGTRITARTVLAEYPAVKREDVLACLALSSELMKHHFSLDRVA